jgi:hypothetical protein
LATIQRLDEQGSGDPLLDTAGGEQMNMRKREVPFDLAKIKIIVEATPAERANYIAHHIRCAIGELSQQQRSLETYAEYRDAIVQGMAVSNLPCDKVGGRNIRQYLHGGILLAGLVRVRPIVEALHRLWHPDSARFLKQKIGKWESRVHELRLNFPALYPTAKRSRAILIGELLPEFHCLLDDAVSTLEVIFREIEARQ